MSIRRDNIISMLLSLSCPWRIISKMSTYCWLMITISTSNYLLIISKKSKLTLKNLSTCRYRLKMYHLSFLHSTSSSKRIKIMLIIKCLSLCLAALINFVNLMKSPMISHITFQAIHVVVIKLGSISSNTVLNCWIIKGSRKISRNLH